MEDLVSCQKRHRYAAVSHVLHDRDVLDIDCGTGRSSATLGSLARFVIGVDRDPDNVVRAQESCARENVRFVTASADALPLDAKSVDVVLALDSFERYADQPRVLREFARVLRWEGRLVVAVRNRAVFNDRYPETSSEGVNDLYLAEFRSLLGEVFPAIRLYGQRFVSASAIEHLGDTGGASGARVWQPIGGADESATLASDDADAFIAVCSRSHEDAFSLATLHTEHPGIETLEQRAARERIAHLEATHHAAQERIRYLEEALRNLERDTAAAVQRLEHLAGGIEERLAVSAFPTIRA